MDGHNLDRVSCYGMPGIGAEYLPGANDNVEAYRGVARDFVPCAICGKKATDVHHWPPRSEGYHGLFLMRTPKGAHTLKPALFALCRDCHNAWHAGTITCRWVWESEEYEQAYKSGELTAKVGYRPNSKRLYEFGHWELRNRRTGRAFTYKEVYEDGCWKKVRGQV